MKWVYVDQRYISLRQKKFLNENNYENKKLKRFWRLKLNLNEKNFKTAMKTKIKSFSILEIMKN